MLLRRDALIFAARLMAFSMLVADGHKFQPTHVAAPPAGYRLTTLFR